jgi:predicted flap endonuclease-1-like 5' DNA nuclease
VLKDDLRDIHGVGDTLSKLLASMGITSFQQVARFTKSDVEMVEAALDCFPGRVSRDDWMGSAREQHILKYGKAPGRA